MTDRCLVVDNIVVAYGATTVLRRVSLTAEYGEIVAIRGANGSGKSTLLRAIAGTAPIAAGNIRIGGRSVIAKPVDAIARELGVAYLRQDKRAIPDLSVAANLTLAAWRSRSYAAAARAAEALLHQENFARLRTFRDTNASSLSGGQRLLLALAIVEMTRSSLLLLDEPLAGADAATSAVATEAILRWARNGRCVLVVEHDEFANQSTRSVLIHDGQIAPKALHEL